MDNQLKEEIAEFFEGYKKLITDYNSIDEGDFKVGLPKCINDIDSYISKDKCEKCVDHFNCNKMTIVLYLGMIEVSNPIVERIVTKLGASIIHLVLESRNEDELARAFTVADHYQDLLSKLNKELKMVGCIDSNNPMIKEDIMNVFKAKLN